MFTALIPDFDHFKGSEGGRAFPSRHLDGTPNLAPGLVSALRALVAGGIEAEDLVPYLAAITSQPAYTSRFGDELTTPGVRVPLTSDPDLWKEATSLGQEIIWLQTYGEVFADPGEGRPHGNIRLSAGDARQPLALQPVTTMPTEITYNADEGTVHLGDGVWGPVDQNVWDYTVGGRPVIRSWFNYRKADPGGRKSSPLDDLHPTSWPSAWTTEFTDLLTVLTRLRDLESRQAELLDAVLASPLLTLPGLAAAGASWPANPKDRRPRRHIHEHLEGTLDLGGT